MKTMKLKRVDHGRRRGARIAILLACGLISAAAVGCGGKEEAPAPAQAAETPAPAAEQTPAPADAAPAAEPETPAPAADAPSAPAPAEPAAGESASPPLPASPAPSAAASGLSGSVSYTGPRPKRSVIAMSADPKCAAIHGNNKVGSEDEIVGANGEVANVFVYVKAGLSAGPHPAPAAPAKLNQQGCMYSPRVLGVMAGQPLEIVNSDPLLHNVHALGKINPEFNFGQAQPGTATRTFRKPEAAIKIKCDVHPWMGAWLFVTDHPYFAVSGRDGKFAIPNLPPGKYMIAAWHEKYGEKTVQADTTAGPAAISVVFP